MNLEQRFPHFGTGTLIKGTLIVFILAAAILFSESHQDDHPGDDHVIESNDSRDDLIIENLPGQNQSAANRSEDGPKPVAGSTDGQLSPPEGDPIVDQKESQTTVSPISQDQIESDPSTTTEASVDMPIENSTNSTETDTTTSTIPDAQTQPSEKNLTRCLDDNYCLNGGTCVLEDGQMKCICPEGFYGSRCQTRNICKTVIAGSLTGDQICSKIDRECYRNDKFFRCSCHDDEYFLFKLLKPQQDSDEQHAHQHTSTASNTTSVPKLVEGAGQGAKDQPIQEEHKSRQEVTTNYLAECRKIDKCIGMRCRRTSEVCHEGKCVCNRNLGYILDPSDNLCKLLNPCEMPTADGNPICGQANCVATYDKDLYRCVCPIGTKPLKVGSGKNSTRCAPFSYFTICDIPLLNKCQHICQIGGMRNHYSCSCLPGYKSGSRVGIDDHMCFFDEHIGQHNYSEPYDNRNSGPEHNKTSPTNLEYRWIVETRAKGEQTEGEKETQAPGFDHQGENASNPGKITRSRSDIRNQRREDIVIKRVIKQPIESNSQDTRQGSLLDENDGLTSNGININKLSPQERCNMYCEDNKICVLESGSTDSYRCLCDRQGYVSVGDKCLNWCAAAEFSNKVRGILDAVCLSGLCEQVNQRPRPTEMSRIEDEITRLDRESSWRPTFECDCTISPLIIKDETSKLCKLNFSEVLNICMPGNEGYEDCVENKNAFCAVLYKPFWNFMKDIHWDRANLDSTIKQTEEQTGSATNKNKFNKVKEKLYTCVCSPEKNFLVDKPRNKERCVDECGLLNVECGRFNRMCRPATIAPEDFGDGSIVRIDHTGVRMNFKRTGCECLPGFNVGPSELLDFTLDDDPSFTSPNDKSMNSDIYTPTTNILSVDSQEEGDHSRVKYMNINSRCLLDYDVVEFHASFKAPADFDPTWLPLTAYPPEQHPKQHWQTRQLKYLNINTKALRPRNDSQPEAIHSSTPGASQNTSSPNPCENGDCTLEMPQFMRSDISNIHQRVVLVSECDGVMATLSIEAYQECIKYRYWVVQKLRQHFIDWRRIINRHLRETFDFMDGNIRLHVNKCESKIRSIKHGEQISQEQSKTNYAHPGQTNSHPVVSELAEHTRTGSWSKNPDATDASNLLHGIDDEHAIIDADIDCELTLHSASDEKSPRYSRKVLLEKQLQKFIYAKPYSIIDSENYYFMAPKMLIKRESFDQLAEHRQLFNPCKSDYEYCDKQTKCEMVDTVNFTCTCDYGYTPIGSRDIYLGDSRKEVCEDINECLFDVCKELANVSTCINEIGDYRCQCNRHYTGDNKRYCTHVCNTIPCKHGRCRLVDDHHAFCECEEGYKETDCSVQDPNVALRRANVIICGSIFFSILLLAITTAISINSQLRKAKKKLKRLEALTDVAQMAEFTPQQPYRSRISSKLSN